MPLYMSVRCVVYEGTLVATLYMSVRCVVYEGTLVATLYMSVRGAVYEGVLCCHVYIYLLSVLDKIFVLSSISIVEPQAGVCHLCQYCTILSDAG